MVGWQTGNAPNWCVWSECAICAIAKFNGTQTVIWLLRQAQRSRTTSLVLSGAIYLAPAHTTIAQPIHKAADADGKVTFTDTPPLSGDSAVEEQSVKVPNSAKPTHTPPTPAPSAPAGAEEPAYYCTQIVTHADNTTIPIGPGNFAMQAALNPRLAPSSMHCLRARCM